MSRTRVQQTQISGSLSSDILDNLAAGSELAAQSTLVGDLNAMRSQLNKIIGVGNWYDELAGTQDLADIQGAMQVTGADAAFQGDVSAVGDLSAISGDFTVTAGSAGLGTPENGYLGYYASLTETGGEEYNGGQVFLDPLLYGANEELSSLLFETPRPTVAIYDADDWSLAPQYHLITGGSSPVGGAGYRLEFEVPITLVSNPVVFIVGMPAPPLADLLAGAGGAGALLEMNGNGSFTGDLSAVNATLSGNVTAISGSFSAVSISGDVAQRLYVVGADGEIKDESGLSYDPAGGPLGNGQLSVLGNVSASDTVSATSGSFSGITIVNETPGRLYLVGADYSITDSEFLTFDGSALSVTGAGVFTGNITAASGSFTGDLSASGDITANDGSFSGNVSIAGDVAQRLYIVGADGEIKDEAKLTFDGSELSVLGGVVASGRLTALQGDFEVDVAEGSTPESGYLGYGGFGIPAGGFSIAVSGNRTGIFTPGTQLAVYDANNWSAAPEYRTVSSSSYDAGRNSTNVIVSAAFTGVASAVVAVVGNSSPAGASVTITPAGASTLTMVGDIKISGDVAQRLYIVGADGELKDEANLTYDGLAFAVIGDFSAVSGSFSGDISASAATFSSDLTVSGDFSGVDATLAGNLSAIDASLSGNLIAVNGTFSGPLLTSDDISAVNAVLSGDLTASGDISAITGSFSGPLTTSGDISAVNGTLSGSLSAVSGSFSGNITAVSGSFSGSVSIAGDVAQRLYIVGADGEIKDESKLTFDGSELAIDGDLAAADGHFTGNVQVDGDLRVKGSMTYIDTQNMRVQDAFIYLATGSAGTTDSGIVLARGAGANMDLVIGQDGGAGEVIFGKADRAYDGDGAMNGIELVPAWLSEIKLGGVEGSLSGSFSIEGNNMKLEAANDLSLAANGESVGLMSAADYTLFDSNFSATSIVGALNELYAAGAGGAAKGNLALSDVTVDVLDFSAVGTLSSADHKFIDVYLNGVLLAPGIDVTAVAVDNVTLAAGVVSELAVDDVFTVVLRGAA